MITLSRYAEKLLMDSANNPGRFEFSQGSDGSWGITPYGPCTDPQESVEIKNALEELQNLGFIRELVPSGETFELTLAGTKYAQNLR
jgi:hypothetical protein